MLSLALPRGWKGSLHNRVDVLMAIHVDLSCGTMLAVAKLWHGRETSYISGPTGAALS